jgi:5-methyltetrahydrofolate--homocysteine methyltransferase
MQRQGFDVPLLIGGATTSRAHTAIKIAPHYAQPVIYVPDASRAVGVVTSLLSEGQRAGYAAEVAADYEKLRAQHASKKGVTLVKLAEARANAFKWNPTGLQAGQAGPAGVQSFDIDLAELVDYIDWGPSSRPGTWPAATRRSSTTRSSARPPASSSPTPR